MNCCCTKNSWLHPAVPEYIDLSVSDQIDPTIEKYSSRLSLQDFTFLPINMGSNARDNGMCHSQFYHFPLLLLKQSLIPPNLFIQKSHQSCFCLHALNQPLIGFLTAAIIFITFIVIGQCLAIQGINAKFIHTM